jgi:acetyltransferase-like isoleucine patch superfamily enzyme
MTDSQVQAIWDSGTLPPNVNAGTGVRINGLHAFRRIRSTEPDALVIGSYSTLDGVQFSIAPGARVSIGNYCCFTAAVIMSECRISIGSYVLIGFNTVIADSDFHPLDPAKRIVDAVACSPGNKNISRPPVAAEAVVIEDDVWIGPACVILKGVHIGRGAWIAPGSMVTRDVPAGGFAGGNPARILERPQ